MLDLWRAPHDAGDPVGCLTSTYTFSPGLFDEQCLAHFLEIESEPDREDLAFLLERESRLGSVYAGVLVDHTRAGVEHSLRWDVLPVRVPGAKQHAKMTLLVWTRHVRVIVASANLTDAGYRSNFEVAAALDWQPESADHRLLTEATQFLDEMLDLVPDAESEPPVVQRARKFLTDVATRTADWEPSKKTPRVRHELVFTKPPAPGGSQSRSSIDEAVAACRKRGASPIEAWIASPFFDPDAETHRTLAHLCKRMARKVTRYLRICVPADSTGEDPSVPRLAAPRSLMTTPTAYSGVATIETLPDLDDDKNRRCWHAKMLALRSDDYSAILIGSSNFTCAGMGIEGRYNTEAGLLTLVDRVKHGREVGRLESVWPATEVVSDPEAAEWLGPEIDAEEDDDAMRPLPSGFLGATYRAGDNRAIVVRLHQQGLPQSWSIHASGTTAPRLADAESWAEAGSPVSVEIDWDPTQPPERLLVRWDEHEAFLPLNVEEPTALPPPTQLEEMSGDDMLEILAAVDPSAAFRAWARSNTTVDGFDAELDSATASDLDPLRNHDLQATFLHRIRRRARTLARLRENLERPVWSKQALEWRLRGMIGIDALADRMVHDLDRASSNVDEVVLQLADFLIVLDEVDYRPNEEGALPRAEYHSLFDPFLVELGTKINAKVSEVQPEMPDDLLRFWKGVVEQCAR